MPLTRSLQLQLKVSLYCELWNCLSGNKVDTRVFMQLGDGKRKRSSPSSSRSTKKLDAYFTKKWSCLLKYYDYVNVMSCSQAERRWQRKKQERHAHLSVVEHLSRRLTFWPNNLFILQCGISDGLNLAPLVSCWLLPSGKQGKLRTQEERRQVWRKRWSISFESLA